MTLRREILRLALPSILANLTVPLVGMVDLAVAGHLPGGSAAALIGGVSIGSMLFDLLYWNFAFLRTGTGGLTAQTYGELRAAPESSAMRRARPRMAPRASGMCPVSSAPAARSSP